MVHQAIHALADVLLSEEAPNLYAKIKKFKKKAAKTKSWPKIICKNFTGKVMLFFFLMGLVNKSMDIFLHSEEKAFEDVCFEFSKISEENERSYAKPEPAKDEKVLAYFQTI